MRMYILVIGLVVFLMVGCQSTCSRTQVGDSERVTDVGALHKQFDEARAEMEKKKSAIESLLRINNLAKSDDSIIEQRKARDGAVDIMEKAKFLYSLASQAMNNKTLISNVANSLSQFKEYRDYAKKVMADIKTENPPQP